MPARWERSQIPESSSSDDQRSPHQMMPCAASPRTFKPERPFFLRHEAHPNFSPALLGDGDIDARGRYLEAVIGIVAGKDELDQLALLHGYSRGIVREAFGQDVDDAIRLAFHILSEGDAYHEEHFQESH